MLRCNSATSCMILNNFNLWTKLSIKHLEMYLHTRVIIMCFFELVHLTFACGLSSSVLNLPILVPQWHRSLNLETISTLDGVNLYQSKNKCWHSQALISKNQKLGRCFWRSKKCSVQVQERKEQRNNTPQNKHFPEEHKYTCKLTTTSQRKCNNLTSDVWHSQWRSRLT